MFVNGEADDQTGEPPSQSRLDRQGAEVVAEFGESHQAVTAALGLVQNAGGAGSE
jgi:hypothetical protein